MIAYLIDFTFGQAGLTTTDQASSADIARTRAASGKLFSLTTMTRSPGRTPCFRSSAAASSTMPARVP